MDDKTLQEQVMHELVWDPEVDAAHIGVSAKDGAVTLTGHVGSYAQKMAAVRAAERVYGVRAVADELEVELPSSATRDDTDLAEEIARELQWNTSVPDTVEAEVRNGLVTLRGEVERPYQRDAAEQAVRHVTGVKGVTNLIVVKPSIKPNPAEVQERIADAIRRMAELDARAIEATTSNGTVHLRGVVHTFHEKKLAENAAKSAPGVQAVKNDIVVAP
jgi:osmotically-inducible protein OsmY